MRCSIAILALVATVVIASPRRGMGAGARRSDWLSASRCGSCHPAELERWSAGPHASASQSLGARAGEGRCESCHGTGYAPAGKSALPDVQCEACHGAGAHYGRDDIMRDRPLALALGLRDLRGEGALAALCASCHTASTRLRPFDARASWQQIGH